MRRALVWVSGQFTITVSSVVRIRIRDPVPFWPLDLGSGMGKKSGSGSYFLKFRNHFGVKILKFFDEDPGSGMEKNSDPGWKKVGSGINIPDPQHWL
jgi:hypothetical protein